MLACDNRGALATGKHGDQAEVMLEPGEDGLIVAVLYLIGPVVIVVIMSTQARDADADGVLGSTDIALMGGVVLEAEQELGQGLAIAIGELVGPDLLGGIAGGGAHASTLHELYRRLQRDGQCPAGTEAGDIGLVDPGACEVQAVGELTLDGVPQRCSGTGFEACLGHSLQHDILYTSLLTELSLGFAATVFVDDEDIGLHTVDGVDEVHHAAASVDIGFLDVADGTDHIEAFLLGVDGLARLELLDGGIGADADIQVAIAGGLLEEGDVAAVE